MDYVYLDESGDLGYKKGSSKFFVITIMITNDNVPIRRIIKKTRKTKLKQYKKKPSELKANKCSNEIRRYVLELLSKENIRVCSIVINKNKVYPYLRKKKEKLYNYIVKQILINIETELSHNVDIIIDKRSSKHVVRRDLDNYIMKLIQFNQKINIRVSHFNSGKYEELQALDFICWSFFRKYEHGDSSFIEILKDKIVLETQLWGTS